MTAGAGFLALSRPRSVARTRRSGMKSRAFGLTFEHQRASCLLAAVAMVVALSACASNTPVLDSAFCRLYTRLPDPSDAVNLKLRANKIAVLTNEQTWVTECGRKDFGGPR